MKQALSLRTDTQDYEQILKAHIPLLDVRAPIEFAQGAFPFATNLPLMQDAERAAIGTCYRKSGQQAAIKLGHTLVAGDVRAARINDWMAWYRDNPQGYLCCARGGLRSHIVQQWLREAGIDLPLIQGGYRALRRHALARIDELARLPMFVVGGYTGCGKTDLIRTLDNGIDLEGAARHRGSSFGRTLSAQPTQASFEHQLAITFIERAKDVPGFHWVLEDESAMIGARALPQTLHGQMAAAHVVVIDDPFEVRLNRLRHDYFVQMLAGFIDQERDLDKGWLCFGDYLRHGLFAIRRRLGLTRFTELSRMLENSLERHRTCDQSDAHFAWLVPLLKEYYDPMYRYQLEKKRDRIVFRGHSQAAAQWLEKRQLAEFCKKK